MSLSGNLQYASLEANTLENRLRRISRCANFLLEAFDVSESIHDSDLQRNIKQLRESLTYTSE